MGKDEWMTLEEAAAYLKVSKPTIYRLCSERRLAFYKLAGTGGRRFKRSDLDALLTPGSPGEEPRGGGKEAA
jgi:excisionase family DNA binding protein